MEWQCQAHIWSDNGQEIRCGKPAICVTEVPIDAECEPTFIGGEMYACEEHTYHKLSDGPTPVLTGIEKAEEEIHKAYQQYQTEKATYHLGYGIPDVKRPDIAAIIRKHVGGR